MLVKRWFYRDFVSLLWSADIFGIRERNIISSYYSVIINKKIPVFSGLGGGTSNAAYLVKYLAKKKNK